MSKGLTLIELVITLAICGYSLYSLNLRMLLSPSLKSISRQLQQELQEAATGAIDSGYKKEILFNKSSKTFYKITEVENSIIIKQIFKLPKQIDVSNFSFGNLNNKTSSIYFYSTGTKSPGTIILKENNNSCSIRQSLRGLSTLNCNF